MALLRSEVNGAPIDCQSRFFQCLGKSRVGVRTAGQVFAARAEVDGRRRLGDEIPGSRPEDVDAEDAAGVPVGENLYLAFHLPTYSLRRSMAAKSSSTCGKRMP